MTDKFKVVLADGDDGKRSGLSAELQRGKAAEHLVVADLILQGYNAFLTDAGVSFDVVVEYRGKLFRVQVKSTRGAISVTGANDIYRFGLRHTKRATKRMDTDAVDCFAFVALDTLTIAYLCAAEVRTRDGLMKTIVEFRKDGSVGRVYPNGTQRALGWGKTMGGQTEFPIDRLCGVG